MSAKIIQVIETYLEVRGDGRKGNPVRKVYQIWSLDGKLLAESDPLITGRGPLMYHPDEEKKEEA